MFCVCIWSAVAVLIWGKTAAICPFSLLTTETTIHTHSLSNAGAVGTGNKSHSPESLFCVLWCKR